MLTSLLPSVLNWSHLISVCLSVCLSLSLSLSHALSPSRSLAFSFSFSPSPNTEFPMIGPTWNTCPLWSNQLWTRVRVTWYKTAAVARPSLSSHSLQPDTPSSGEWRLPTGAPAQQRSLVRRDRSPALCLLSCLLPPTFAHRPQRSA